MRAGFSQPQFQTLYASLQQLRGVVGPVATPLPVKLSTETPEAARDDSPGPAPAMALPPSDPSSASSTALMGAAAVSSGAPPPGSTADTGLVRSATAPVPPSIPPAPAQPARALSAPQPAALSSAASKDSTPTAIHIHASVTPVSAGKGSVAGGSTVFQHAPPIAQAPLRMLPGQTISVGVPDPVATASGAGVGHPHLMQIYLQHLALERGMGVPTLGMHVGGGMAMIGGAASQLAGLHSVGGGVGLGGLAWRAGLGGPTHAIAADPAAHLGGPLRPGVLLGPGGHAMLPHPLHDQRGFHEAAGAGGLWTLQQPHSAANAAPVMAYTPMLLGDHLAGHPGSLAVGGQPAASAGSVHAPSAFTQVAGDALVQRSHLTPHAHPQPSPHSRHPGP